MVDLAASLEAFGADLAALHLLDQDGPQLLPYATLIAARRNTDPVLGALGAVYEWQGAPLLFIVDADRLEGDEHLHRIRRLLAMRGDAPYLGVLAPGRLDVYGIALDKQSPRQAKVVLASTRDTFKQTILAQLGNERPKAAISQGGWISNVVLNLLTGSITKLIKLKGISDEAAISLVGRALFTRFLADRNLLPNTMSQADVVAGLFDNRSRAAKTSKWLDETFNGDLLPLSGKIFDRLPPQAFHVLGDILRRAPDSQLFLGWEEKWDNLDFAHIPVGVLSQAYELYLRNHAPAQQKREGGFYTPRAIADLMVRASFRALERSGSCKDAKILDPAAGAGVFLLTAFRELVAARWRAESKRPETKTLRAILYRQIVGFDINEAALRFAALGLYLLSIELDPNPRPVDKLGFQNLRGKVLHRIATNDVPTSPGLGSLGPAIGKQHVGKYDLVIGNPPWTTGTKLPDWQFVRALVARVAKARGVSQASPPLPNECLDLPFLWRAMEWAKPGGQLAFALHARILFQQGDGMADARKALFQALDVKSIINGVELRLTKVWPEISAPFCLLIANNTVPHAGSGFRLISPHVEQSLNDAGSMRIDALNAEVIPSQQLIENPELLKILFRGSKADLGIVERIRNRGYPTLEAFWRNSVGTSDRGVLRGSGNGYQKLRPSSRTRRNSNLPGADARYLRGRPEVTAATFTNTYINASRLDTFSFSRIHDPRAVELFTGPLVLVHKSPPAAMGRVNVAVSDKDVVFNETFYGYSPIGHSAAQELVRYLALVLGSKLTLWIALVTSGEFGFEREVIEKAIIDRIPIPNFDKLDQDTRSDITPLFKSLQRGTKSWEDVDEWVTRLYGLGDRDLQVISDTLEYNLPFADNRQRAQDRPKPSDVRRFCDVLTKELEPWKDRFKTNLEIRPIIPPRQSPWLGIELIRPPISHSDPQQPQHWEGLLQAAHETATSEVFIHGLSNGLLIGRLAQQRYWSDTQARLLAQRIIWGHLDLLQGTTA